MLTIYDYLWQGELAHRLVKRLYGLTNKRNAIQQIGKKYSRHQALRSIEKQEAKEADQAGCLKDHHIISQSKNVPLNLLAFVQGAKDPAKIVRLWLSLLIHSSNPASRISFRNYKTIFWAVYLGVNLMATHMNLIPMKIETTSVSAITQSTAFGLLESITPPMTSVVITTQSTHVRTHSLWSHLQRWMPTQQLILSGMVLSLVCFMRLYNMSARVPPVLLGSQWTFSGSDGWVLSLTIHLDANKLNYRRLASSAIQMTMPLVS